MLCYVMFKIIYLPCDTNLSVEIQCYCLTDDVVFAKRNPVHSPDEKK